MLALLGGCIRFTPFATEPSETDLTAKNLARLAAREPATTPFKFVAIGDTHDGYDENLADTVSSINARDDVDFVLVVGDMSDRGLLGEFEFTQGRLGALDVPVLTVIGNHDALGDGAVIYQKMYGPLNYTFHFASTKFVMFNSNTLEFPKPAPDRDWLDKETKDREGAARVVWVTHQNVEIPDDVAGAMTKEFYRDLLAGGGVDLVVHGHLDDYSLRISTGTPMLQCSTFERLFFYTVVTINDTALSFERCRFDDCQPIQPEPE